MSNNSHTKACVPPASPVDPTALVPVSSTTHNQLSVLEKVRAINHRHDNGYYVGWCEERLNNLPAGYRQRFGGENGSTPRLPSKTERRDNKMLAWAYKNNPQFVWAKTNAAISNPGHVNVNQNASNPNPNALSITNIQDIIPGMKVINIIAIVLEKKKPSHTKDGHVVYQVRVADKTASINLSLWNSDGYNLQCGDIIRLTRGYAAQFKNSLTVYSGKNGMITRMGSFYMLFNELPYLSNEILPDPKQNVQSLFLQNIRPGAPYRNSSTITPIQQQQQQQQQQQPQLLNPQQQQQLLNSQQQQQQQRTSTQQRPLDGQNSRQLASSNSSSSGSSSSHQLPLANGQPYSPALAGGDVGGGGGGVGGGQVFNGPGYQRPGVANASQQGLKSMQQSANSLVQQQRSTTINDPSRPVSTANSTSLDQQKQQQQQQPLPQRIAASISNPSINFSHMTGGNGQSRPISNQQPRPSVFGNPTSQQQRTNSAGVQAASTIPGKQTTSAQQTQSSTIQEPIGQQGNNQVYQQGLGLMQLAQAGQQMPLAGASSQNLKRKNEESPFSQNSSTRTRMAGMDQKVQSKLQSQQLQLQHQYHQQQQLIHQQQQQQQQQNLQIKPLINSRNRPGRPRKN